MRSSRSSFEVRQATAHPKITCVKGDAIDNGRLLAEIRVLTERPLRMDYAGIRAGLRRLVPEYQPYDENGASLPLAAGAESGAATREAAPMWREEWTHGAR